MVLEGFCSSLYYELGTRDWTACPLRQLFELKTKSTDDQTTSGLLERAQGAQRSFGADPLLLRSSSGSLLVANRICGQRTEIITF
jgi:hypothetical protein